MLQNIAPRARGRGFGLPNSTERHSIWERYALAAGHRPWSHCRNLHGHMQGWHLCWEGCRAGWLWKGQVSEGDHGGHEMEGGPEAQAETSQV